MTESSKLSPSGIILGPSFSEIFNSPSFLKAKRKALAHNPTLRPHIAKAPPSPNSGPQAVAAVTKKSQFFADKVKPGKTAAKAPTPAKARRVVAKAFAAPHTEKDIYAKFFASPGWQKMRRKGLSLGKLEGRHVPKAPPASLRRDSKVARVVAKPQGKKPKVKAEPGLTAAYVYTPGVGIQFQPAKVVKDRSEASAMLREGQIGLFSAIAFCDPKGRTHTGTLVEIFSMLPARETAI